MEMRALPVSLCRSMTAFGAPCRITRLVNSGTAENGYGYWFPDKANDGATGGGFVPEAWGRGWIGKTMPRGELAREFVATWKAANPNGTVIYRDLAARTPAPVSQAWVHAAYTHENARTAEQNALLAHSDELIQELESLRKELRRTKTGAATPVLPPTTAGFGLVPAEPTSELPPATTPSVGR